jgi:hypothetical protein
MVSRSASVGLTSLVIAASLTGRRRAGPIPWLRARRGAAAHCGAVHVTPAGEGRG